MASGEERQAQRGENPSSDPGSASLGLTPLPSQPAGSLTRDLAIDTDDVSTLKQRLGRARERLAFYESFDRIIQENIRRSSELMIEARELHEKAEKASAAQVQAQAELAGRRVAERAHYAALLSDLRAELDRARASLEGIAIRVTSSLDALGTEGSGERASAATSSVSGQRAVTETAPAGLAATETTLAGTELDKALDAESAARCGPAGAGPKAVAQSVSPTLPEVAPAPAVDAPTFTAAPAALHHVDVLVHGVPTARVAISLQNHLRGLDHVSAVEAREFVEGLLRLQVTTSAALGRADLSGWPDGDGAETVRALPELLEISLPGTTER